MPAYAVSLLEGALGGDALAGARVLVLGATYRGGVKETAFSGVFALRDELRAQGADVVVADPLLDDGELRALGLEPWDGAPVAGAVVQADHAGYRALTPADLPGARAVVDGRDVLDAAAFAQAGVTVARIGRPQAGAEAGARR
jgi:UDP-N-acetyl-D-mannosaminuronic acid dehydrogenase